MKSKLALLLAGITFSGSIITMANLAPVAQAQPGPMLAQFQGKLPQLEAFLQELDLTESQQQQFQALRQSTRSQVSELLTEPQQQQFQAAVAAGEAVRDSLSELNLSAQQRQEIKAIVQSQRAEARSILTPEQQSLVRQKVRARFGNR